MYPKQEILTAFYCLPGPYNHIYQILVYIWRTKRSIYRESVYNAAFYLEKLILQSPSEHLIEL